MYLLNYLLKDELIIISEPWTNAIFGTPILNEDNDFRKKNRKNKKILEQKLILLLKNQIK